MPAPMGAKSRKLMKLQPKDTLQKVTDSKLKKLLRQERITDSDTDKLTEAEKLRLGELTTELIRKTKIDDRDEIFAKIENITDVTTKADMWNYNHSRIMRSIEILMREYGRMPSISEIAQDAEISRNTTYRHLKEYRTHPFYLQQLEGFRILSSNVLLKVYWSAMAGDIGSQKLYFNVMGLLSGAQSPQTQNNFIQINNMVITQEAVKRLNPEQLLTIESVLKSVISEVKTIDTTKIE